MDNFKKYFMKLASHVIIIIWTLLI